MDFGTKYHETQEAIDERKKTLIVRRLMDVQRRSKIKPSSMNPVLLNSASDSTLTGGGYWTDRFNEHAFLTNASPEAIKRVGDELKAAMKDLPPSSLTLGFDTRKHKLLIDAFARLRQIVRQEAEQKQKEDSLSKVNKLFENMPFQPPPSRRRQYIEQNTQQQQTALTTGDIPPSFRPEYDEAPRPASGVGF